MYSRLILLLLLSTVCCSQTVYKGLGWSYSYKDTHGNLIDTSNVYFKFYHLDSTVFTEIGQAQGGESEFLLINSYPWLYDDKNHAFYMRAYWFTPDTFSTSSDTVYAKLRKPSPESVYDLLWMK